MGRIMRLAAMSLSAVSARNPKLVWASINSVLSPERLEAFCLQSDESQKKKGGIVMFKIIISSGWITHDWLSGLMESEAIEICQDNNW